MQKLTQSSRTSTEEICKHKNCNNIFKRYAYQVKKGTGLYCSQRCAAKDNIAKRYKDYVPIRKPCVYCGSKNDTKDRKLCRNCNNIKNCAKLHGLDIKDYFEMLESQGGRCAICRVEKCATGKNFAFDHDHLNGKVRGLLCCGCNIRLGWYENKKQQIENYVLNN